MLVVHHVATRHQYGLGGHVVVVSHQQTAFTGVDVLVGLRAVATYLAPGAGVFAIPLCAHGVSTILNDGDAVFVANSFDRLQISNMTAHVRE